MRKFLAAVLLLACQVGYGQFFDRLKNPKIPVPIKHPPGLNLQVKRVAFGPAVGDCSDQLIDMWTGELVQGGVEVLDRQHMDTILREQNVSISDRFDPSSAIQLGRILGSGVMVFVKMQRCATEQQSLYQNFVRNGAPVRVMISRTRAYVQGSVQVVNLADGRIFGSQTLEYSPQKENRSEQGQPEFPSDIEVKDQALRLAAAQGAHMLIPWTETKELIFFNDNECGLKRAAEMLKAGAIMEALNISSGNVNSCRGSAAKETNVSHAYYNLGLLQMISEDYEQAMMNLREAARLHGGDIVNQTIAECQRSQALAEQMRRIAGPTAIQAPQTVPTPPSTNYAPLSVAPAKPAESSIEERLRRLDDLFKKGLLTKPEYDAKKAEILKEL